MGKTVIGKCRLCGKETTLTFEHVPPEAAFNNESVKLIDGDECLKTITDLNRAPWDFSGLKYKIQQKGNGDYYLCEKCNNTTGAWYVPYYRNFIYGFTSVADTPGFARETMLRVSAKEIRPLAIFKQIMTMFSDINYFCPSDEKLQRFLLDKDCTDFNCKKYRVFMYVFGGGIQRIETVAAQIMNDGTTLALSEIVSPPLGFVLYIDMPEVLPPYFQNPGCEITEFSKCSYEDICSMDIVLPIHECNIIFPANFKAKEELRAGNKVIPTRDNN